ncbi:MAG: hypothetical protein ACI9SI_000550 [Polaribacter sp.]|jgi:hypothetical protein
MNKKQISHLAIGTSMGSSLRIVYGVAFDNIALGISLGSGSGTAIGVALALISQENFKDKQK